eukprot:TRINITY_DN113482_c0_g1_i1.p1 TRINITY_DN113482_c0_g1~~TRINITY_DN113482_c0_g1_i1.p1  ORF type:complete len:283 (+),score=66.16 TRINITY_DN113482_c0_g1_i1:89-937(+)
MTLALVLAVSGLSHLAGLAEAIAEELFTSNAVCKQRYCINPVFPGYGALPELEARRWVKQNRSEVGEFMEFCGNFVDYDPAVPMSFSAGSRRIVSLNQAQELTLLQDRSAVEMFFMHLSGMGLEMWDYADPWKKSNDPMQPCVQAVARMSCLTHFPEAPVFALANQEVGYLRPCSSFCQDYLKACQVECCDESVTCVFERPISLSDSSESGKSDQSSFMSLQKRTGYIDSSKPSALCTGSAAAWTPAAVLRQHIDGSAAASVRGDWLLLLLVAACALAGAAV